MVRVTLHVACAKCKALHQQLQATTKENQRLKASKEAALRQAQIRKGKSFKLRGENKALLAMHRKLGAWISGKLPQPGHPPPAHLLAKPPLARTPIVAQVAVHKAARREEAWLPDNVALHHADALALPVTFTYLPATHSMQSDTASLPATSTYRPTTQSMQSFAFSLTRTCQYLPAPQ